MLQQIAGHTPLYVWAILAFLVYRGVAASRTRTASLRSLFIIPAVMTVLALLQIARCGAAEAAYVAWLGAAAVGVLLAWRGQGAVAVDRAAGTVTQAGSWLPLVLMLTVFCVRYAVAVAGAMQPALAQGTGFALGVAVLLGLCNGLLAGRVLRCLPAWRSAAAPAPAI